MKNKEHNTAFYLETLVLILVFVAIILVLTQVFGSSRKNSSEAKAKTGAVCLCQNVAEAFSAAKNQDEFIDLLGLDPGAIEESPGQGGEIDQALEKQIQAHFNNSLNPDPAGSLLLRINWGRQGTLRKAAIEVLRDDKSIYLLKTSVYDEEGWQ